MARVAARPRGLRARFVLAAVAAGVLAGCGDPSGAASPSPTPRPSPTPSALVTPTPDPTSAAVVKAYLDATAAFVHAELAMDPNDPALVATMTGEELSTVKRNLIIDRAAGLVARGDITPQDPHVVSIDGGTAVVRDCEYSALLLYDRKTGGPAPGVANGPQSIGITATFVYVDGAWKESLADLKVGSCPLGF